MKVAVSSLPAFLALALSSLNFCPKVNSFSGLGPAGAGLKESDLFLAAASLISGLYKDHGSWQAAVRHYHSYEPKFYMKYSKKIALAWLQEN